MNELNKVSDAIQRLKAHDAHDRNVRNPYPVVRIAGKYLRNNGIEIGTHVEATLAEGKIIDDHIPTTKSEVTTFSSFAVKGNKITDHENKNPQRS